MNKHKITLMPHRPGYDSRDVRIGEHGCGYVAPDGTGPVRLLRCPECNRENYAMAVHSGICAWCNWDANQ